jgi:osomolarity two-component system, sensor histidine kinase TcsA
MADEVAPKSLDELARDLRETEQTFRLLVTCVKEYAIFMLDPEGNVITWNIGAERLKGYSADEIIGRHFSQFYTQEALDSNHPQNELDLAKKNGSYEEEGWRIRKDGTMFWAHVVLTAVYDGPVLIGFAKVTRDLTEHRALEQEREAVSKRISDTNVELRRALESKERFLSTVSHEMRSPMAGIIGMTELLTMQDFGAETNDMVRSVFDSSHRLLQMLNNLLDSARLESGKLKLQHVSFRIQEVLEDVARLVSIEATKKSVMVTVESDAALPEELCGDEYKVGQILANLAFNAVKFTKKGNVKIECKITSETPSVITVHFAISDTGIGIKEIDRDKLFQPFVQADDAAARRYGGTGLGLSISKQLVEHMHGRIGLTSEYGVGSTFWFEIPFDKVDCALDDADEEDEEDDADEEDL